jgi:hypothetical protein
VSDWATAFLGVIAFSTLVMALIQVGAIIAGFVAVRKAQAAAEQFAERAEVQLRPVATRVMAVARQAEDGVAVASEKVHRIEDTLARILERVDAAASTVQSGVMAPAREGAALAAGAKAMMRALRGPRARRIQ